MLDCDFGIDGPPEAEFVKKSVRRQTRSGTGAGTGSGTGAGTEAADAAARELWLQRSHSLLLGAAIALIVATPLIASEAAVVFGSHVVLIMAWLVLTAAWLMRCLLGAQPVWHVGPAGAALAAFLCVHSLSAVIMMHQGHARPTLNALWVWVSFGLLFFAVRQLVRRNVEQRAVVSIVIALAVGLASFGVYQTAYIYPQQRAEYKAHPARVLSDAGIYAPLGSPQRRHFEDRLAGTEPTGPFALTNSLAGFLAPCLVLLAGLAASLYRSLPGRARHGQSPTTSGRGLQVVKVAGVLLGAGAVLACLLLTKSRAGYLAVLAGLSWLAISDVVPRVWLQWRRLAAGLSGLIVIVVLLSFYGGLDRQLLTEASKSMLYRWEYWQASMGMIADHPGWGCGPGNFKDYYTEYKLPESSETIADPHNFLVEVAATAGLPALVLFLLVGLVLWWRVRRYRDRRIGRSETPRVEPAVPMPNDVLPNNVLPIYVGAVMGFLLAYPAGWVGGQSPSFDMLWVALPATLVTIWFLQPWVLSGSLPAGALLAAAATLLVNLLAAGGIGFPGVAGLLWLLVALLLNVVENGEQADSAAVRHASFGPLANRGAIGVAAVVAVLLLPLGYLTLYRPVLAGHEYTAYLAEAVARNYSASQVVPLSRRAAEADPWWGEPCENWADALHQQWIARPSPWLLAEFDEAVAVAQQRNGHSAGLARKEGDWLITMYTTSSQRELLERAVEAYSRAVRLYPNSSLLHAQLAWACYLLGESDRAEREADEALRLDQLMPHVELKLQYQVLSGLEAVRVDGGAAPSVGGGDPEQLMRDIRNTRSSQE